MKKTAIKDWANNRERERSKSEFHITPGVVYNVFGMVIWDGELYYLIVNDSRNPGWKPADLFDRDCDSIPEDWKFRFDSAESYALWGYPKLVEDEEHYRGLSEGDDDHRLIFFKYLLEVEAREGEVEN